MEKGEKKKRCFFHRHFDKGEASTYGLQYLQTSTTSSFELSESVIELRKSMSLQKHDQRGENGGSEWKDSALSGLFLLLDHSLILAVTDL